MSEPTCSQELTDLINEAWDYANPTFLANVGDYALSIPYPTCVPTTEHSLGFIAGAGPAPPAFHHCRAIAGLAITNAPRIKGLIDDALTAAQSLRTFLGGKGNGSDERLSAEIVNVCVQLLLGEEDTSRIETPWQPPDRETGRVRIRATLALLGLFAETKGRRRVEGLLRRMRSARQVPAVYAYVDPDEKHVCYALAVLGEVAPEPVLHEIERLLMP